MVSELELFCGCEEHVCGVGRDVMELRRDPSRVRYLFGQNFKYPYPVSVSGVRGIGIRIPDTDTDNSSYRIGIGIRIRIRRKFTI
jgi:hypothetical protein